MKKLLNYCLLLLILLVVLIAAGIMIVVNFINPNDYRTQINQLASEHLQQPIAIHGDINWQFLPTFGIVVHDISLGDEKTALSAHLKTAKIGVYLWPLLSKHVSVKEIVLDHLSLDMNTVTGENASTSTAEAAAAPGVMTAQLLDGLQQFDLQKLALKDASVTLHHQLTQVTSQITDIDSEIVNIGANKNSHFEFALTYQPDIKQSSQTVIKGDGKVLIDTDQQQIDCTDCHLQLSHTGANHQKMIIEANSDIQYQLRDQTLKAPAITGDIDALHFNASVTGQHLDQKPDLQFSFDGETQKLSAILKKFAIAIKTQDPQVLQKLHIKASGQWHDKHVQLQPLSVQLDDSTLKGSVQSDDLSSFSTQFTLDQINLGAYLKPAPSATAIQLQQLSGTLKLLLPAGNGPLAVSGPLKFSALTTPTLKISQFSTLIDMKDNVLALNQSKANLLDGSYHGSSQIDWRSDSPKVSTNLTFSHIQIQPLVSLVDPAIKLSGLADFSGDIHSAGLDMSAFKQNLDGNLRLKISNGVLHGINIQQWLKPTAPTAGNDSTPFGDLTASLTINNGVISNQDLVLTMPIARTTGHGTINLPKEGFDYRLLISPLNHADRGVPLWITGTFTTPVIQLDKQALVQQVAASQQNRLADRLAKRTSGNPALNQALGNAVQNLDIKNFLNR